MFICVCIHVLCIYVSTYVHAHNFQKLIFIMRELGIELMLGGLVADTFTS